MQHVLYLTIQPPIFFHPFRCILVEFQNIEPCCISKVLGFIGEIRQSYEGYTLASMFDKIMFFRSIGCIN